MSATKACLHPCRSEACMHTRTVACKPVRADSIATQHTSRAIPTFDRVADAQTGLDAFFTSWRPLCYPVIRQHNTQMHSTARTEPARRRRRRSRRTGRCRGGRARAAARPSSRSRGTPSANAAMRSTSSVPLPVLVPHQLRRRVLEHVRLGRLRRQIRQQESVPVSGTPPAPPWRP